MSVRDEDLLDLWNQNRIAIHYPDRLDGDKSVDNDSINPDDYPGKGRSAMRALKELAENGGYVWAESRVDKKRAKVGRVRPGGDIQVYRARWTHSANYPGREGTEAALKTVQLEDVDTVEAD